MSKTTTEDIILQQLKELRDGQNKHGEVLSRIEVQTTKTNGTVLRNTENIVSIKNDLNGLGTRLNNVEAGIIEQETIEAQNTAVRSERERSTKTGRWIAQYGLSVSGFVVSLVALYVAFH